MNPSRPGASSTRSRRLAVVVASVSLLLTGLSTAAAFHDPTDASLRELSGGDAAPTTQGSALLEGEPPGHLVVSEVMTGGASASDEFIELYNPGPMALPLEGLEVIYVTATGGTITRKAEWASGAAPVPAGAHVLVANAAGAYAAVADVTYTNGLAATGGSVAIRIQGASTAIDAVGWGNAANAWMEGLPAAAATAGHSLERLPGGSAGSGQDSDQNSVDFVEIATPDPQNSLSPPVPASTPQPSPTGSGSPTASTLPTETPAVTANPTPSTTPAGSASPTPTPVLTPSPQPTAAPMTIADARALPDGSAVVIEGTSLTDNAFHDGGGFLADASAGIAVLLSDGSFPRGRAVRVNGVLDQRFSQRTIKTDAGGVTLIGAATDPSPQSSATGSVGEALEGELVEVVGSIVSARSTLSTGIAVDLDDGSGVVRVVAGSGTGIDTSAWQRGATLRLRGVVGQRDSTGSGTTGYRVQPRDPLDIVSIAPPPSGSPSPGASGSASPAPSGDPSLVSIAAARSAPFNARVTVRGIVTLPSDLAEEGSAAIQDSSGAILLRLGDEGGSLSLGELVEVSGTRSTKAGMETIRLNVAPRRLGSQSQPDARRRSTGALAEADEAMLVVVRGAVTTAPRRTSAENVYFDLDDGSGPIRIFVSPRAGIGTDSVLLGSWLDLTGVLGQETTGRLPDRGYRIWPRRPADLRVVASATPGQDPEGDSPGAAAGASGGLGVGGTGGVGAGNASSSAGVTQQVVPRLALALPTSPAAEGLPARPEAEPAQGHGAAPAPAAAGLLALAGLLLGGGVAAGSPGLLQRLRAAIGTRFGAEPPDDDGPAGEPPPDRGLPRLMPLTVLDGTASGQPLPPPSTPSDPRTSGGRILPPT